MLAATFFTLQAPEPDQERFSELRCSKVTLGATRPTFGPLLHWKPTYTAMIRTVSQEVRANTRTCAAAVILRLA
jgi:hypothetical protein